MTPINPPFPVFSDVDGQPLEDGYVYIGVANQNPEVNPVQVFWDAAGTIPAVQPIRTSGGYAIRNGTPGTVFAAGDFSITVRNKRGGLVYTYPTSVDILMADYTIDAASDAVLLRLAQSDATSVIGHIASGAGSVATTAQAKMRENVSVFDILTAAEITAVQAGTSGDLRAKLQTAIDNAVGKTLKINAGIYGMIPLADGSPNFGMCLDIPSNSHIVFEPGAQINLLAHNNTIYQMMRVWNRTNVVIEYANLDGKKNLNSAVTGESGMGIDIRGGSNITVFDPVTNNTWGDGIYIAQYDDTASGVPKDIRVENHVADGCRRQGMSLISGNNVVFNNPAWRNISGTPPAAGCDIEPDGNTAGFELKGIRINNPITENCAGSGIAVSLQLFAGANPKTVDIIINNHRDTGSAVGYRPGLTLTNNGAYKMEGNIITVDPVWENNLGSAFYAIEPDVNGPAITLIRPKAINPNRSGGTSPVYDGPFLVLRDTGSVYTYQIGNVSIVEPSIVLTSGSIPALFYFRDQVNGAGYLAKCSFENPREVTGTGLTKTGYFLGEGYIEDKFKQMGIVGAPSGTYNYSHFGGLIAPNVSVSYELQDLLWYAGGPDLMIYQPTASSCIVRTGGAGTGTGNFVGCAVGQRLQANGKAGAYLRIRPLGGNVFLIVENVGPWAVI